jgi:hypothetical protein
MQSAVCMIQTTVNDTAVIDAGGSVQLDYSDYQVTSRGLVSTVAVDAPLSVSIQLANVSGWAAPESLLTVTFNSSKCLATSGELECVPCWC